jgi:hypothetical protein
MAEANVSAITNARMQAADDLKAVTGIYDGQLGARSNETSGRAILARQSQGQTANFHFQDNLAMAIRYTGRILIDLIPKIYSGPKTLRILGEDGSTRWCPSTSPGSFGASGAHCPGRRPLRRGRLHGAQLPVAAPGGRRPAAGAREGEPRHFASGGDLLVESMDIPNGDAIADAPPEAAAPEIRPPDDKQPPPQVLAQQLQQATQMVQRLSQELHQAHDKLQMDALVDESRERIELIKVHADLMKTAATLDSKEHVAMLAREAGLISKRLGMADLQPQPEPQPLPTNGVPNAPPDETQTQEPTQDTAPTEGESQDETQAPTEGESQEEAQEASEAEGQEAEGQEGEEGEEAKEGEEKKDDADAGAQATRKRAGGWQRKIDRLERERALLLEQLAAQRHGPPPAAKPDKDKTPEEKAADYIDSLVEKRLNAREAEQREQAVVADWQRRTAEVRAPTKTLMMWLPLRHPRGLGARAGLVDLRTRSSNHVPARKESGRVGAPHRLTAPRCSTGSWPVGGEAVRVLFDPAPEDELQRPNGHRLHRPA